MKSLSNLEVIRTCAAIQDVTSRVISTIAKENTHITKVGPGYLNQLKHLIFSLEKEVVDYNKNVDDKFRKMEAKSEKNKKSI